MWTRFTLAPLQASSFQNPIICPFHLRRCSEGDILPGASLMAAMAPSSAVSSAPSGFASSINNSSPSTSPTPSSPAKLGCSRRILLPALVSAPFLLHQHAAVAKDIPLFGLRKRVQEAEKEVVKEVKELVQEGKELVKEGEKELSSVVAPAAAAVVASPKIDSPPPAYQAAAVGGAELVAVLVATSIVKGLVSES